MSFLRRFPIHYGWIVLVPTFLVVLTGSGIRASGAALIPPLEAEFGWNRAVLGSVIGLSLLMYGISAPIAGRLIDRYGPRRVMTYTLLFLAAGVSGTLFMNRLWQMLFFWGILMGLGAGGVASVMPATVANAWFVKYRGLVLGILNSAASTGQLIFIPVVMGLMSGHGWRYGPGFMAVTALVLIPVVVLLIRDDPAEVGLTPYGVTALEPKAATPGPGSKAAKAAPSSLPLTVILRSPTFWFLSAAFFICGATSSGVVGTHLIANSVDHGIPEGATAAAVGVMGAMNFVGVLMVGWLTDRIDPRKILAGAYLLRAASLLILPFVRNVTGIMVFGVVFGLDWYAMVPPIIALAADTFGRRMVGSVYGWIFLAHQIGSSLGATAGGLVRVWLGDYQVAFLTAAGLAVVGMGLSLFTPVTAKAASMATLTEDGTNG